MRIHRLRLEAIGPFPGRHEIDFDELSAGGLFLLDGPTGAGKSTLIDAITYGLYGSLGSAQLDERLPSAHARQREPSIEVVLTTAAGIFRVRRTPPYDRPKRRGEGTTRQHATARLWRLAAAEDPAGEPVAGGTQEVGTELQEVLGLDRVQFSQTVVLPQGRFATFLRAKPEDRAQVLRDVFGTAVYHRLQEELTAMAREARRRTEQARAQVASTLAAFNGLLAEDEPVVEAAEGGPGKAGHSGAAGSLEQPDEARSLEQAASAVLDQRRATATAAAATEHEAQLAEHAARATLDEARELDRLLTRRAELLARRETLGAAEPEVASLRQRLAEARRAATVDGELRRHATLRARAAHAEQHLGETRDRISAGPDHDLAGHDVLQLEEVAAALQTDRGNLTEPHRLEAELAARRARLDEERRLLAENQERLGGQAETLADRPAERSRLATGLAELREAAMPVTAAEATGRERLAVRDAAQQAEALATDLTRAQEQLARAVSAARQATEDEHSLRLRWIDGAAADLAGELTAGHPCPVCGSVQHPSPAEPDGDGARLADVEEATNRRRDAERELRSAEAERARLAERLTAAQRAAGEKSASQAQAELDVAQDQLRAAHDAVGRIAEGEAALAAFDAETTTLTDRHGEQERELATAAERLRGADARLAADEERCRLAAGTAGTVAARLDQLDSRLEAAQRLLQDHRAQQEVAAQLAEAWAALDESLAEAGFAGAEPARAAQLTATEIGVLEARLEEHDATLATVRAGLAEEAIARLTGQEVADVAAAGHEHSQRQAALTAATGANATAATALQQCERAHRGLLEAVATHREVTQQAGPVLRMSEVAAGGEGNTKATSLATFVLLRRFEDVVAAANDRLSIISGGRFSLLRKETREGRARRAGLGLEVLDHHTESRRDPHTLSGGETFYVSLCLALGLADVVSSEAGGISLETLFIDEGFGALDPQTLDGVLAELGRLQAGGRAVGVVSHVTELKDRIAERIEVRRLPDGGSTLEVRV